MRSCYWAALIVLGAFIAVWQISVMRQRAQRLYDAEQPALAVLMAHNHFQRFQAELQLLSETHDAQRFTAKAIELRGVFNGRRRSCNPSLGRFASGR